MFSLLPITFLPSFLVILKICFYNISQAASYNMDHDVDRPLFIIWIICLSIFIWGTFHVVLNSIHLEETNIIVLLIAVHPTSSNQFDESSRNE